MITPKETTKSFYEKNTIKQETFLLLTYSKYTLFNIQ